MGLGPQGLNPESGDKKAALCAAFSAEDEGFEPPVRCRTTVFKTAAIDHSANPPWGGVAPFGIAKVVKKFYLNHFTMWSFA